MITVMWWIPCFTFVIALFAVLTYFIYREQLRANKVAERAWVVPDLDVVIPTVDKLSSNTTPIICVLRNKGRTPAWITAMGHAAKLVKKGGQLPKDRPYAWAKPLPLDGTVLPPNAQIERGFDIDAKSIAIVEAEISTLYVYGIVKYRDIHKEQHETRYCFVFKTGPIEGDSSPRGFYIGGCEEDNKAT